MAYWQKINIKCIIMIIIIAVVDVVVVAQGFMYTLAHTTIAFLIRQLLSPAMMMMIMCVCVCRYGKQ
jgi:multisubunit Na+/H+ antiporter MnhG subunit